MIIHDPDEVTYAQPFDYIVQFYHGDTMIGRCYNLPNNIRASSSATHNIQNFSDVKQALDWVVSEWNSQYD